MKRKRKISLYKSKISLHQLKRLLRCNDKREMKELLDLFVKDSERVTIQD